MIITPPIAPETVTSPDDRFHCGPYKAVLLAGTCEKRQRQLAKPIDARTGDYFYCEGCETGALILLRLKAAPLGPPPPKPTHGPSPMGPARQAAPKKKAGKKDRAPDLLASLTAQPMPVRPDRRPLT